MYWLFITINSSFSFFFTESIKMNWTKNHSLRWKPSWHLIKRSSTYYYLLLFDEERKAIKTVITIFMQFSLSLINTKIITYTSLKSVILKIHLDIHGVVKVLNLYKFCSSYISPTQKLLSNCLHSYLYVVLCS